MSIESEIVNQIELINRLLTEVLKEINTIAKEIHALNNNSTSLTGSDIHQTPFLFHIFYRKVF
jgi:hypothetical protein